MKLYYLSDDGTYREIGEPVEITETYTHDAVAEYPDITLRGNEVGTLTLDLRRKDKKVWGEVFGMPQYKVTEWMFPKKKKRGTIRRKRRWTGWERRNLKTLSISASLLTR